MISSLSTSEIFPACFSCNYNFNQSHSSLGFPGKNFVEIPETMIAGDLSKSTEDLSVLRFFYPIRLISNLISFPNSKISF